MHACHSFNPLQVCPSINHLSPLKVQSSHIQISEYGAIRLICPAFGNLLLLPFLDVFAEQFFVFPFSKGLFTKSRSQAPQTLDCVVRSSMPSDLSDLSDVSAEVSFIFPSCSWLWVISTGISLSILFLLSSEWPLISNYTSDIYKVED